MKKKILFPNSSPLSEGVYDDQAQVLWLRWRDDGPITYRYRGVKKDQAAYLQRVDSPGRYVNHRIRGIKETNKQTNMPDADKTVTNPNGSRKLKRRQS